MLSRLCTSSFNSKLQPTRSLTKLTADSRGAQLLRLSQLRHALLQPIRSGHGGPAKMVIRPSRYQWNKFWDDIHFYTLLPAIPLGLISLYCYIFIGPAELTEIPEDYEPQEHEYERHPITRAISYIKTKYIVSDQEAYERDIAYINEERQKVRFKKEYKRIKEQESLYGDYRGYYFVPANPRPVNQRILQRQHENLLGDFAYGFQTEDPRDLPSEISSTKY